MKRFLSRLTPALITLSLSTSWAAYADTLKLKDGQSLTGTLMSRDANGIVFDVAGQKLRFKSEMVASINLGDDNSDPLNKTETSEIADKTKSSDVNVEGKSVSAPVGTRVVAKTHSNINSRQHKAGHKFTARLEADMVVDGTLIAPQGSTLYGLVNAASKSGRLLGKSTLELEFTDIKINNQLLAIATTGVQAVTEGTGKSTVGTTARTAAIGGLINGSKGARDGAKVGLGVSILTSGNAINIPAGTLLEFQLTAPLSSQ